MLVIEGPDGVGKTTLARRLQAEMAQSVSYQHWGKLPDSFDFYHGYLDAIRPLSVCDRFIMSEVAYGIGARHHSRLGPLSYHVLDAKIALVGGITVVIHCENDAVCEHVHRNKGESAFTLEEHRRINAVYRHVAQTGGVEYDGRQWTVWHDFGYQLTAAGIAANQWPSSDETFITLLLTAWRSRIMHARKYGLIP
jgi:hypothetical protein